MTSPTTTPPPGRPVVLESAPRGLWPTLIGAVMALLAPLFGFLIGSSYGPGSGGTAISPLQLGLFLGVILGGCGVLIAGFGGLRLCRTYRDQQDAADQDAVGQS